tara:strand:- start:1350 stop:1583 length:234 start_codon:yes stop_codon:yes gene_type:complete
MNSIERRFRIISTNNPHWAAYVCLAEAITCRNYNHKTVRRNFLKLVPKEDYEADIEKEIITELDRLSNTSMDVQNRG